MVAKTNRDVYLHPLFVAMTVQYGHCDVRFQIAVLRHSSLNRTDVNITSLLPKLRADTCSSALVSASLSITNTLPLTNIYYA